MVAMVLDEEALQGAARDGLLNYEKWPDIVERLIGRMNWIAYNEFPTARHFPTVSLLQHRPSSVAETPTHQSTTQITQTPSTPRQLPPVPPFPGSAQTDTSVSHVPNSQPDLNLQAINEETHLPTDLVELLMGIADTIRNSFLDKPPHTIQRLSELILEPRKHYKTVPAWLRALDRVVSVSSTADIFPLSDRPAIVNGVNGDGGGGILWNNNSDSWSGGSDGYDPKERDGGLGSDESLGGALLTPIPWLRDITNEDSNGDVEGAGAGSDGQSADDLLGEPIQLPSTSSDSPQQSSTDSGDALNTPTSTNSEADTTLLNSLPTGIRTSSDPLVPERPSGAVTQGELIRLEQEAGVVPVAPNGLSSASSPPSLHRTGIHSDGPPSSIALGVGVGLAGDPTTPRDPRALDQDDDDDFADGPPHARGPDVVGTVDMGLVGGKGIEVKIGSPPDERKSGQEKVDVNDAQDILQGGNEQKKETSDQAEEQTSAAESSSTPSSSTDEFVHVSKEATSDEMQLDDSPSNAGKKAQAATSEDEDIVLVDADGATEEQREKIDATDLNVGNETADGTGV